MDGVFQNSTPALTGTIPVEWKKCPEAMNGSRWSEWSLKNGQEAGRTSLGSVNSTVNSISIQTCGFILDNIAVYENQYHILIQI